jgi:hypothetical protein
VRVVTGEGAGFTDGDGDGDGEWLGLALDVREVRTVDEHEPARGDTDGPHPTWIGRIAVVRTGRSVAD